MVKPIIKICNDGAVIKSSVWHDYNMFNAGILLCWTDFLNGNK